MRTAQKILVTTKSWREYVFEEVNQASVTLLSEWSTDDNSIPQLSERELAFVRNEILHRALLRSG